jgi:putative ABC transport system ATP-binding protein
MTAHALECPPPIPAVGQTPAIELTAASREYPGGVRALDAVDLVVAVGEMIAVVGPSGSGKSTMLNLVGTLDLPSSGSVAIGGHDVSSLRDRQLAALRADYIGFVFQNFHLAAGAGAVENVADGLLYAGHRRSERRRRAREALERVGLGHRLENRPNELSGGEKQRVAIARAIVGRPQLLLADEPTGALDSRSGEVVMDLLHELNAEGTTVVVITHDRDLAASLPRQVQMLDGAIIADSAASGSGRISGDFVRKDPEGSWMRGGDQVAVG